MAPKDGAASLDIAKKDPFRRFALKVKGLGGLNTAMAPNEIGDNECQSLWNYLPIGKNIWRKIASSSKYCTPVANNNIVFLYAGVLGATLYEFVILADGSAGVINGGTYTQLAAGNTFGGSNSSYDATMWENTYFLIIDSTKGYFTATATQIISMATGISQSALNNPGSGYNPNDTFTVNGGVVLAQGTVLTSNGIAASTLGAGGSGYAVNDTFQVNNGINLAQGQVTSVSSGVVTGYSITQEGSGYSIINGQGTTATSGSGTGLTINITGLSGVLTYTLNSEGAGYTIANNVATTATTGVGTGLTLNITALTSLFLGTAIAVWQGRVFIANGRVLSYSAALDWSFLQLGSGSFTLTSSDLTQKIMKIIPYQDSIFLIGDHAIIALTGTTISSDPTTWYQMEIFNALGSTSGPSVFNYQNQLFLQNEFGIYRVASTQSEKVDVILDITKFINLSYFSTVAQVNNLNFYLLPIQVFSPFSQAQRNAILAYCIELNTFSLLDMGWDCNGIFGVRSLSDHSIYAWSGDSVYRLFQGGAAINSLFKGKLFDFGAPNTIKAVRFIQVDYAAINGQPNFQVSIDSISWAATGITTASGIAMQTPLNLSAILSMDAPAGDMIAGDGSVSGSSNYPPVQAAIYGFIGAGGVLIDYVLNESTNAVFDIVGMGVMGNIGRTYR